MAIADLNETIMTYIYRRNELQLEITQYETEKSLAQYELLDYTTLMQARKTEVKNTWKAEYEANCGEGGIYEDLVSYTEIDEYIDEIDKIEAEYEIYYADLTAWETDLDNNITTADTELTEVEAYLESYESMLSNNISNDFNYGLN